MLVCYPTRGDIESFLHRQAYLASIGEYSPELRARVCRDVKGDTRADPGARADPPRRPRRGAGRRFHPRLR